MRLGGVAAYATEIHNRIELLEALSWAQEKNLPIIMIGGGSNIVWKDTGFNGLLVINKIEHYDAFEESESDVYVTVGSGEIWDSVVKRTTDAGLTGIEALSLIPGSAGATPVQNVGAYGQEVGNVLLSVEAFDIQARDYVTLAASDCGFGYRMSRFNSIDHGRFYITGLTLHLMKGTMQPPFYGALQSYYDATKSTDYSPQAIRNAVISIRSAKLPDPSKIANNGSFFSNPIINEDQFNYISENYVAVPHWSVGTGSVKVSAAWLIEQSGFKDVHDEETGMATWARQPLVLINEHAKNTADLLKFRQKIIDAVKEKFNIELRQEPELLPNS